MRKYDFTPLEEYLTREITPAELAAELEAMLWRHVDLQLRYGEAPDLSAARQVYCLRSFTDTLKTVAAAGEPRR